MKGLKVSIRYTIHIVSLEEKLERINSAIVPKLVCTGISYSKKNSIP